jgi:eukaryotic-like serine/threonine-protein kinase
VLAALLIVCGSLGFAYVHFSSSKRPGGSTITPAGTPNIPATTTAEQQATSDANTILSDPLSQNIRGWPESSSGPFLFQFKNGAYHITNNDPARVATAILSGEQLDRPFVYTITMDEIHGDDTSINNESGMILRFNSQVKNGKQITTFYTFEVINKKGGQYQFWKYDNSQGPSANPWKQIANHQFGSEFHQGQGPGNSNTFKLLVNNKTFTLIVNGKQVWSVQDGSLVSGQVGMLVNLKGTEVAFSNLKLTWS